MAQLAPIPLVAPGTLGLNTEEEFTLKGPQWATKALNLVFDRSGRLAARKGWTKESTTSSASADLVRIHEYVQKDGTTEIISTTATKVLKGLTDLNNASNDITSSTAPTAGRWKLLNFNNKCVGFQEGELPVVYTGTGDFSDISASSGTVPDGGAATAAYGRLWVSDSDNQVLKYCALLDETDWGGSDAGELNLASVWTNGTDEIVAVEALGANLVVFGRKHIVIWTSEGGSELGLIPTEMYVADVIEGTGCVARDSVQVIGEGDMLFLSRIGVQSLKRVIQFKNNPLTHLTKWNRGKVNGYWETTKSDPLTITSVHSDEEGFYLLNFPSSNRTLVLDTSRLFQDEEGDLVAPTAEWLHTPALAAAVSTRAGTLYMALGTDIGRYTGNADNDESYDVEFRSSWLDLGPEVENRLKILKELRTLILASGTVTVRWSWAFDFGLEADRTKTASYTAGTGSEYGIAEYNVDEYAVGLQLFQRRIDAGGEGQYIRMGLTASIQNAQLALQQATLFPKLGRMV